MATSPLGGFVDLTPYIQAQALRQAQAAQPVNSLEASIRGFQQAQAINNLPQQQLSDQIALQLQQAKLQDVTQAQQDILHPEQAAVREVIKNLVLQSTNPASGITYTQTPGSTPILNAVTGQPTGAFRDIAAQDAETRRQAALKRELETPKYITVPYGAKILETQGDKPPIQVGEGNARPATGTSLFIDPANGLSYTEYRPGLIPINQIAFGGGTPPPAAGADTGTTPPPAPLRTKSDVSTENAQGRLKLAGEKAITSHLKDLRHDVEANPEIKEFQTVYRNFQNLDNITKEALAPTNLNNPVRTGQDTAAIDAFNIIFNPKGVVRQFSYVNTLQNRPLLDQGASILQRYFGTGGKITPQDLQSMRSLANIALENSKATARSNVQPLVQDALDSNIPLNKFLPDYLLPENLAPTNAAPNAPVTTKNFATEAEARKAGFGNNDIVTIGGQLGRLK